MNSKDLCCQVIALYGAENQMDQAIEECAELIVAIRHYRRGRASISAIAEEIADVEIMMTQLRLIFNADSMVEGFKGEKIERMRGLTCSQKYTTGIPMR